MRIKMLLRGLSLTVCLSAAVTVQSAPFKDGDRVVFFGDSITHGGFYGEYVNLFYATRYPERNIWFSNSGWSGATAQQGLWSIADDVVAKKPTVVTVMFGMNDINRDAWPRTNDTPALAAKREDAIRTYDSRMDELVRRVRAEAGNPEIIYFTPSPYDQTCLVDGKPSNIVCNDGLAILADHVRSWAAKDKATCVDLQGTMAAINADIQKKDPSASLVRGSPTWFDRVHPGPLGHTVMLYEILKAQDAESCVDEIERDANGADALTFACTEKSLPFPMTAEMRGALGLVPFEKDFNREILRVRNLKEGRYAVKIDGTKVGVWTAAELAEGVNLALNEKTPQYRQAAEAAKICQKLWAGERMLRNFATRRRWMRMHYKIDPDAPGAVESLLEKLLAEGKSEDSYEVRTYREYLKNWPRHAEFESAVVKDRAALAEAVRPRGHEFKIEADARIEMGAPFTDGADCAPRRETLKASGPWEMAQKTAPEKWMPAVVPGTVLTTLVKNGVVPDPYWGLNNKIQEGKIPDVGLGARDFYTATYRTKVTIPEDWARKTIWLRPEGINYRGEIKLNGEVAATTLGTFARNAVDVSEFLKPGVNDLEVEVRPVDHPGRPFQKPWGAPGEWFNGGDGEIGRDVTVLMGAGWDFMFSDGIRDRHAGIWKDIFFIATDKIRIDAPFVRTKLNEAMDVAELSIEVDLVNAGYNWGSNYSGTLEAEIPGTDVRLSKRVKFYRGERRTEILNATLKNPKLWWPRNKGPQNLYTLNVRIVMDPREEYNRSTNSKYNVPESVSDTATIRFGVREFTSDQSGKDGARQFYVNRRKIFIRGTNWIPEGMLRQDDARMEKEMRLTAESGVNLVRLWAGGITESDMFYDLCDEYGLLVWQEFWMTGDTRHPDDPGLYLDCVAQQVKRIRHHASIAHWVCSNESTDVQGVEELVRKLTGTTSWMQNSECDGVHDGSPYFPVNPMGYYDDTASGNRGRRVWGFSPEYGTCALPAADQCRKFMPENLLWPMDIEAWKYREGGGFDRMTEYHHQAVSEYGESKTFDEYCRKSQVVDALAHRALWEAWNLVRNDATGLLFWYNNTPIPQLGSHAWDYDLDQTASFFAQKSALEPLHVQYEYLSNRVSVVSDVYGSRDLTVAAEVYDFESRKVWENTAAVKVDGEGCTDVFKIPFAELAKGQDLSRPHFIKLRLVENGKEIASTFYWRSGSEYKGPGTVTGPCVAGFAALSDLPKTALEAVDVADGVRVTNTGDRIAFMVEVQCFDDAGRRIVPVRYSDNFFSLLPGESRIVRFERPQNLKCVRTSCWNDAR